MTTQSFQSAWDDAKQTAARNGEMFDPNKAFGYALSSSFINALLQRAKIDNVLGPWLRQGKGTKLIEWLKHMGRSGATGMVINPIQGGITDMLATEFEIEDRDVFDSEKRREEALLGFTLGAGESGFVGVAHAVTPVREQTPQLDIELGVRTKKKAAISAATLGHSNTKDYKKTFFTACPELKGKVIVHHAVPQHVLKAYPNIVTESQMHSLENLRGIPIEHNSELHLRKIRKEWNRFYKKKLNATQAELLQKATEVDRKYGAQFVPSLKKQQ